jgi:hypothetical protein
MGLAQKESIVARIYIPTLSTPKGERYRARLFVKSSEGILHIGHIEDDVITKLCTGEYDVKCSIVIDDGVVKNLNYLQ